MLLRPQHIPPGRRDCGEKATAELLTPIINDWEQNLSIGLDQHSLTDTCENMVEYLVHENPQLTEYMKFYVLNHTIKKVIFNFCGPVLSQLTTLKQETNVKKLMNEQNKLWSKWIKYYNDKNSIDSSNFINNYNKWLFENIFIINKLDQKCNKFELF